MPPEKDSLDPQTAFEPVEIDPGVYELDIDDLVTLIPLIHEVKEEKIKRSYQGCATLFALGAFFLSLIFTGCMYILQGLGIMTLPDPLLWGLVILTFGQTATLAAVVFKWIYGGELAIPSFRDLSLPGK